MAAAAGAKPPTDSEQVIEVSRQPSLARSPLQQRTVVPSPRVGFAEVTKNNLGTVRQLCSVLFEVVYSDLFYKQQLEEHVNSYCLLLYYNDIPVGLLTSRLERPSGSSAEALLYIATLGVLAPYRRQGMATALLNEIIRRCEASWKTPAAPEKPSAPSLDKKKGSGNKPSQQASSQVEAPPKITRCRVHVQTSNEAARDFWEKNSFEMVETLDSYYTRITPASAWKMEREINRQID